MRTLYNLLRDKRYANCNLKIGSISGSSFWLCKKNYIGIDNEINQQYVRFQRKSKKTLDTLVKRLETLDSIYEKRITEQLKRGVKNPQEYRAKQERLRDIEKRQLPKRIGQIKYDIAVPFLERHVKATYNGISPDEKPCLIVYITGCERGEYWTIKEYERKIKVVE